MNLIKDNNPKGPEVIVEHEFKINKNIRDSEPNQQILILSCGHWCYNTWGNEYQEKTEGEKLNCRLCGDN